MATGNKKRCCGRNQAGGVRQRTPFGRSCPIFLYEPNRTNFAVTIRRQPECPHRFLGAWYPQVK